MSLTLSPTPQRLDVLVEECLKGKGPDLAARSLSVTHQIAARIPEQAMDRALMTEAIGCLLAEAIRAATPSGRLRVTVKANRNALMLAVKAPGPGMGQVQREILFTGEARPGTLARARAIVSAHGGVTWANAMPGRGATYYITLPVRRGM